MQRSFLRYTHLLLLPVLALGLVLTGCDSSGSNGGDPDDEEAIIEGAYPDPSSGNSYAEEVAINLQSAGLGIRLENNPSASTLLEIYTGPSDSRSIERLPGSNLTPDQTTYGDLGGGVDLSAVISKENLLRSDQLEAADTDQQGQLRNADQLIRYYLNQAQETSSNGVDFSQLSEKGVAGALTYYEGAEILNDFADDGTVSSDPSDKWNEAFGHFGAPRDFAAFLDYNSSEGLVGSFQDVDGDGGVDLVSETVYIWAGYTAERAAAAEGTGNPNDFARRAFEAFREGREAITNGNTSELSEEDGFARTALDAWEATVAVNVIHYVNGMQSALENVSGEITKDKLADVGGFEDSWGEAKAFAWALQFNDNSTLNDDQLRTIHDQLRNDPPYGEGVDSSTYSGDLDKVKEEIQGAYSFEDANVSAW
ncbi:hypothetical protein [Salinibacter ruber]|uniref:hypothetical protein n=1 Tax=Salinibacter ruber TaxID=146919 RepID=UPI00216A7EE4|nr:hypothetical protein [Salinibacter ruber]MCS3643548.1 hypothetical protein [Salinibacter ruber]